MHSAIQVFFVGNLLICVVDAHRQLPQPFVVQLLCIRFAIHNPGQHQLPFCPVRHRVIQSVQVLPNFLAVVPCERPHEHRRAVNVVLLGVPIQNCH
jgi:hypothetical protein